MKNRKTIYFRFNFDEGKHWGFGHLNRSLEIYSKLKNNFKLVLILNSSKFSKNYSKKYLKDYNIFFLKKNNENEYSKFLTKNSLIIFDTLGVKNSLIKNLKKKFNLKIISLEDSYNNQSVCDLKINSKIFFGKKFKKKNNKIYNDIKYMVIREEFKKRKLIKIIRKKNYKILVASGGSDYKNLLFRYSKLLLSQNNIKLSALVGPGVTKDNKIFNLSGLINLIKTPKNLKKIIETHDLIVTAGGTFLFECLCLGKIVVPIKNYSHQNKIINYLIKKKLVLKNCGNIKNFKNYIHDLLIDINVNIKNYVKLQKNAYNFIDTDGLNRTIKLIKKLIK